MGGCNACRTWIHGDPGCGCRETPGYGVQMQWIHACMETPGYRVRMQWMYGDSSWEWGVDAWRPLV